MSLTYAERQPVVAALRCYLYDAPDDEYSASEKARLLNVVDKFERWGYGIVVGVGADTSSAEAFDELMQKVAPENIPASPRPHNKVFNAFYL